MTLLSKNIFILCFAFLPCILGLAFEAKYNGVNVPFIKNQKLPVCKECKHFRLYKEETTQNIYTYRLGHCALFGKKDYVSGHISYEFADHCRLNSEQCSIEGLLFEVKDIDDPIEFLPNKLLP